MKLLADNRSYLTNLNCKIILIPYIVKRCNLMYIYIKQLADAFIKSDFQMRRTMEAFSTVHIPGLQTNFLFRYTSTKFRCTKSFPCVASPQFQAHLFIWDFVSYN